MTIDEAITCIMRGEDPSEYKKRIKKLRRLCNERDFLQDAIEVLGDDPRAEKKRARLEKVMNMIERLA